MSFSHQFIQANGIRQHYLEWRGHGPVLVLVHGMTACALKWRIIAEELAPRYHILAPDLRGHGQTEATPRVWEWRDQAQDCIAFLDALDLRDAVVVAHSAGGVSMVVAAAERPERVSRLVLVEPSHAVGDWIPHILENADRLARRAQHRKKLWSSRQEMLKRYEHQGVFRRWRRQAILDFIKGATRVRDDGQVEWSLPLEAELHLYATFGLFDPWPYVAQIQCPILFVVGDQSFIPPHSRPLQKFCRLAPQTRVVRIPGGTHFSPWELPEAFLAALDSFLLDPHAPARADVAPSDSVGAPGDAHLYDAAS